MRSLRVRNWISMMRPPAARAALALAAVLVSVVIATQSAQAQTLTPLDLFELSTDGGAPLAAMIQATDGNLYGVNAVGGAGAFASTTTGGTFFQLTPSGTLTILYNFCSKSGCTDGSIPYGALVQAANGNFYGTTTSGGAYGGGSVFEITPGGSPNTLHSFCEHSGCPDGRDPFGGLVQAPNGDFYGITLYGGASSGCNSDSCGTVFKITPGGALTTLHSFCSLSKCADGSEPFMGLVQGTDGNFYGTTYYGGTECSSGSPIGCGTVFKITPSGMLTTLHNFCSQEFCADGSYPGFTSGPMIQATNGEFYGTTGGGQDSVGTVFKITSSGTLANVFTFESAFGEGPNGLIQGNDGNFYGTTFDGAEGGGTIFELTPGGTLTTPFYFPTNWFGGAYPNAALLQNTDGTFYGVTSAGGHGYGTAFSLVTGLGAFVETQTNSGKAGAAVNILGTDLTGATSVKFSKTAAEFTVASSSEITTTVPAAATTGLVTVTMPSGTLTSIKKFRVTPQIKSFTPSSDPVGTPITITGVSLDQTTKVTFGGVTATPVVVKSNTEVIATVPTGAKTGKIVVTTAGGTAASATSFTVTR